MARGGKLGNGCGTAGVGVAGGMWRRPEEGTMAASWCAEAASVQACAKEEEAEEEDAARAGKKEKEIRK